LKATVQTLPGTLILLFFIVMVATWIEEKVEIGLHQKLLDPKRFPSIVPTDPNKSFSAAGKVNEIHFALFFQSAHL
jgi:hypothetical protein